MCALYVVLRPVDPLLALLAAFTRLGMAFVWLVMFASGMHSQPHRYKMASFLADLGRIQRLPAAQRHLRHFRWMIATFYVKSVA